MKRVIFLSIIACAILASCKHKGCTDPEATNYDAEAKKDDGSCEYDTIIPPIDQNTDVKGYSIFSKLIGIWDGPVSSPTPLGSFPQWIVDFRPISSAQISAKNELDSVNDIFMSFFIAKYDGGYKMFFRNGGGFAGQVRASYMVCDSVNEGTESYYRFVDPISGGTRVYTEVLFKQDSLIMTTYTNHYNTQSSPSLHMKWQAVLKDQTSAQNAVSAFSFPQKEEVKDFTHTFDGQSESVYYGGTGDPYPEAQQPYLGVSTVNITVAAPATVDPSKKVLYLITTQPLFSGVVFQPGNLKYRSRYVNASAQQSMSFDFNYMHPGTYYVNAFYDSNSDYNYSSGDYMNSNLDVPLTLSAQGTASANVTIDYLIP
ncbi:MAG: hypothetical protein R2780_00860 [Crocinitomicaceae bacterium]|nr:hypothetical protein [Crocinitomicaceae bacterium]